MKKSTRSLAVLFLLFLACLGLARIIANQLGAQAQTQKSAQTREVHSKVYKDYEGGRKIRELIATETGEVVIRKIQYPPKKFSDPSCTSSQATNPFLQGILSDADAVVVGVLKSQASDLTEGESFIFTDYEMTVEEVIKDNSNGPIQSGNTIIVTRPGGTVQVDGRTVRAVDEFFKPFEMHKRYLLFLRFIPDTGTYRAYRSGSFLLRNNKAVKLAEDLSEKLNLNDVATFLTEIRSTREGECSSTRLY